MNDRFKFRVWCDGSKCFHVRPAGQRFTVFALVEDGQLRTDIPGGIIEQCTGLKDKNGQLIFEGDIVTYTDLSGSGRPRHFHAREVRWYKDSCNFNVFRPSSDAELTVIGNIHENPELLEQ